MFIFYILFIYFGIIVILNFKYPLLKWDWSKADLQNISLPKNFMWGSATAAHQVEGNCKNNNWSNWEKSKDNKGNPRIKNYQKSGDACNHWDLYNEDFNRLNELGLDSYRFSLEWSKIEPQEGVFDQKIIKHYSEVINSLINKNIIPVITLHHFTHPIWFDEIGAFEKKENIFYFKRFCEKMFNEYSNEVKMWCTINEPGVFAVMGYFAGIFPPGKNNPDLTAQVIINLLDAHVDVYHSLKNHRNGSNCKIGIVKNINQFDPWRRWNLLDWLVCSINNHIFNSIFIDFFKKGKFNIYIPGFIIRKHSNLNAADSLDFFGLNYYSHSYMKFKPSFKQFFENKFPINEIKTDMEYTIYAEGFYRAIKTVSILNKPIFITENGIADKKDDRRTIYIERYLFALQKAIKDGFDIRGYFYWSLMDNFEWAEGYDMCFGLYEVNFKTQKRILRKGAERYKEIIINSKYIKH